MFPILRLPDLRLRSSYTVLPFPNAIDTWLGSNPVKICKNYLGPVFVHLGDLPSDQVVCTVQLHAAKVSSLTCLLCQFDLLNVPLCSTGSPHLYLHLQSHDLRGGPRHI